MDFLEQLVLFVVSLTANLFSAFAGGGAGLLQLPALILLGLPFAVALATHKLASVALGIGAAMRHLKSGSLDKKFAAYILVTGLPGVIVGANVILWVPGKNAETALGVLTLGLGLYSAFKKDLGQICAEKNRDARTLAAGGLVLFLLGILNGSLTSGSGLLVTVWLVRWFGLDYKRAVAYTLILVGMFWNGTGALTLGVLGEIRWDWIPMLLAGSLLGGYLGAHMAIMYGNQWIKRMFEVVSILVGIKLIIG